MSIDRYLDNKPRRLTTLADSTILSNVRNWISTGCQPLDIIMGGGVPVGRMTEIYGDTSTGKSLLAAHILAEAQMVGATTVLFDTETATSIEIMEAVGVDPETLLYSIPETLEELYDDLENILDVKKKEDPDGLMVIVWDSVAATSTDAEVEAVSRKGMGAATMAIHARIISQLCRIANVSIARYNIAFIIINQTRQNIGVMFGPDKSTFGGRAVGYYSSIRLEMKQISKDRDKAGRYTGVTVKVGVTKNKVASPFGVVRFPIRFGFGIDEPAAILMYLKDQKVLTGTSWKYLNLDDGTEIRFQDSKWPEVFYENEDDIRSLLE